MKIPFCPKQEDTRKETEKEISKEKASHFHSNSLCLLTQGLVFGLWFCVAVAILATVFFLCVAVAIPAIVILLCWCGPCRFCARKISGQELLAMVSGRKESWRMPSRLMVGRSGCANSARSRMCGRGGVVSDATPMSRQGCVRRTGRRSQRRSGNGQQARRRQAERRTGRPKNLWRRMRGFGPNWSILKKTEWRRSTGGARLPTQERKWHGGRVVNGR